MDASLVRARMILRFPFWGVLSLNLGIKFCETVDTHRVDTMSTDGRSIFINQHYWESLSDDLKMSEIAHEVFHCAFGHLWRCGGRNRLVYNIACDIVTDYNLKLSGLEITKKSVLFTFGTLVNPAGSVEEVYEQLLQAGLADNIPFEYSDSGRHNDWSSTETDDQSLQLKWKSAISSAAAVSYPGTLPGFIKELIDDALSPKLDWRQLLREFLMSAKSEYRWMPPNKRFLHRDMIIPSLGGETLEVIFAIDTSGSMTMENIRAALSEVTSIYDSFQDSKIWVVQADFDIQSVTLITDSKEIKEIVGRGGTRLLVNQIYKKVIDEGGNPNCLIYFTDGYGDVDDYIPIPVIWLLYGNDKFSPPFGWLIKYNEE